MAASPRLMTVAFLLATVPGSLFVSGSRAGEPGSGVAVIPQDAAFVSATLRLREPLLHIDGGKADHGLPEPHLLR